MIHQLVAETQTVLGRAETTFRCCATEFAVHVQGRSAEKTAIQARRTAKSLEEQLNAFAEESAVGRLNREESVETRHVAAIGECGLEYYDRSDAVFDVRHGTAEHELKAYLRGETDSSSVGFEAGSVTVDGASVRACPPESFLAFESRHAFVRVRRRASGTGLRVQLLERSGGPMPPRWRDSVYIRTKDGFRERLSPRGRNRRARMVPHPNAMTDILDGDGIEAGNTPAPRRMATDRLVLRRVHRDDADFDRLHALFSDVDDAEEVFELCGWDEHEDEAETRE